MKKTLILLACLPFIAASCDFGFGSLDLGGGVKGIFKSEDAGETFRPANILVPKGDIGNITVNSLTFDSARPDQMYIGAANGAFKSENGGKSWRYILSGIAVYDIAADPFNGNSLYASGLAAGKGKIIKTLDGGASWVDIFTEASKNNPVVAIAVASTNSQVVLAGLTTGEVLRSTDGGHTWQTAKDFSDRILSIRFGANGSAYALTAKKGLNKSQDLGVTWNSVTEALTQDALSYPGLTPVSVSAFDYLALDRRQGGVLYLGTDQGLFRTVDDGTNWSQMALPLKNASLRVSSVAVNPGNSNNIFAAVGSTLLKSLNGGVTWETKVLGTDSEIRTIQINPASINVIYLGLGSKR